MRLDRPRAHQYLKAFDFESLFIEEIGWDIVDPPETVSLAIASEVFEVSAIAQKRGFKVYQCFVSKMPDRTARLKLERQLQAYSKSHLLILADHDKTRQEWLWLKSKSGSQKQVRSHSYKVENHPELLLQKLEALVVPISEESQLTHVDIVQKVKQGFDVEQVTRQFFQDFEQLHQRFCLQIAGIEDTDDRRWYASVLLNRLMFVYFLQRRYFLDHQDPLYLQHKLEQCHQQSFYEFLKMLFFEGFAQPEPLRSPETKARIGQICYLNGGLFLQHPIEQKYPQIQIDNAVFRDVLDLFSRYSWHLDDRPDKDPNEINPDILGYIFEKYINQKEFGAYYTRPEITEYLCDRTINKLLLERLAPLSPEVAEQGLLTVIQTLDLPQCDRLLNDLLPSLTLLDPACGSGAFLVAAMKTLINIYTHVVARSQALLKGLLPSAAALPQESSESRVRAWLQEAAKHPSIEYYIKKRIITDNLYGVDIMAEATEIAKLRLFLALVASAKTVADLEPLPNIDFNIMAGNSLIGLIRVDAQGFDRLSAPDTQTGGKSVLQGNLLQPLAATTYQEILADKNHSIALYKKHAFQPDDQDLPQEARLLQLRDHIDKLNREAQRKLNQLLLEEFSQRLGIKYEEAQLNGKPKKRLLTLEDINALKPFHWGYHFDTVFARGGFDAIITNPPWEIFKPQAKEFFAKYSDIVTKNKMDIKTFEKEKSKLLKNPEIAKAWNEYQSQFPHVSAYFRSAEDYINQISMVNGKKAGTDINLYKLFLERCYHLLRKGGECGIVIPSGIYTDLGTKQLREMLFSQTKITGLFGFENRRAIFEGVDSRFKFVILTFEKGGHTDTFPVRFMRHEVAELAAFPAPEDIVLEVPLIRKLSPDSLSIMEFKEPIDITIAEKMLRFPLLGETIEGKWNLKLTREFDMTNDSHLFKTEPAPSRLPLYEGKMIHQFTHQFDLTALRYWIDEREGRTAILGKVEDKGQKLDYQDYRLGFRKIARNTDERTLIAAIIPPNHFCSENFQVALSFDENSNRYINYEEMLFLCALFNSFCLDSVLRQRISANVNFFYIYQLSLPRLQEGDPWFSEIVERAAKLICTTPEYDDLLAEVNSNKSEKIVGVTDEAERARLRAELDGIVAHLYGLTEEEFQHILSTFPIVPDATKQAALQAYRDIANGL